MNHHTIPTSNVPTLSRQSHLLTTQQMHPQNGPPLPLDQQLCLPHNIPTLPPLPFLHIMRTLPTRLLPIRPLRRPMVATRHARLPRSQPLARSTSLLFYCCQRHHTICPLRALRTQRMVSSRQHHDDRGLGNRKAPHARQESKGVWRVAGVAGRGQSSDREARVSL
jgi:hypothetical protein